MENPTEEALENDTVMPRITFTFDRAPLDALEGLPDAKATTYRHEETYDVSVSHVDVKPASDVQVEEHFYDIKRPATADCTAEHNKTHKIWKEIPVYDILALREFLSNVDISRFGFGPGTTAISRTKENKGLTLRIPISKKNHGSGGKSRYHSRSTSAEDSNDDDFSDSYGLNRYDMSDKPAKVNASSIKLKKPKPTRTAISLAPLSPLDSPANADLISRSASSSPRAPYRGRHGLHPVCASCNTDKTPYWRDSWNQGFILCNACGLRYSKFKRRCVNCNYVPRKEDKNQRQCSQCGGPWVQ